MKMGSAARKASLVGACFVAGLVAVPGVAVAKDAIQDTFITNTTADPVPVAPQGTTQVAGSVSVANAPESPVPVAGSVSVANAPESPVPVAGTVTVANPTPAPAARIPVQAAFEEKPITNENPFAVGILYEVPDGKVLTVEHFQAHYLFSGVRLRQASLSAGCFGDPEYANIDRLQVFFPDEPAGLGYHVVGGPVTLHVPGGSCLRYEVGAVSADIADGTTLFVYGGMSGYLTDAPAA